MMARNPNDNKGNNLSIQVRLDGLSFFVQDIPNSEVLLYESVAFSGKQDPVGVLQQIELAVEQFSALREKYHSVTVIFVNDHYTVIPLALFDDTKLTDYLKFNTKILKTDYLAYDTIEAHDMVSVYVPYANITNYFFDLFGAFTYHHHTSLLIRHLLDANASTEGKNKMFVNMHNAMFDLLVVNDGKLILANTFTTHAPEDFIYYILFTAEQLDMDAETFPLHLSGKIAKDDPHYGYAYKYVRNVEITQLPEATIPGSDFILRQTATCV